MEPVSALGVACNVLQPIDVAWQVVSGARGTAGPLTGRAAAPRRSTLWPTTSPSSTSSRYRGTSVPGPWQAFLYRLEGDDAQPPRYGADVVEIFRILIAAGANLNAPWRGSTFRSEIMRILPRDQAAMVLTAEPQPSANEEGGLLGAPTLAFPTAHPP
ncbi:hypothetical protein B0T26DRAFT_670886 [Lasiosphaeria miniovina]|uniref:Uncharacterized protein n=1 Tax=Lasiosphaeria miniovina TaxID=1954250 RepID=A0AA40EEK8_9PEZI|nr:uncharacterized protein B0T26DRAFT_670886 [Lasiosphaeria miniovina]KAK0734616.1 hypothetical protein B0T26DRAFT_670886 [Lasiosphaeria miniovina]